MTDSKPSASPSMGDLSGTIDSLLEDISSMATPKVQTIASAKPSLKPDRNHSRAVLGKTSSAAPSVSFGRFAAKQLHFSDSADVTGGFETSSETSDDG